MRHAWLALAALFAAFVWLQAASVRPASHSAPLVVLDPGHGGPDPGAIAPSGLQEARVNWGVAVAAARALARYGYRVLITRSAAAPAAPGAWSVRRDLATRAWRANRAAALVLVSIHANSEPTGRAVGPIVYWRRGSASSQRLAACLTRTLARATGVYHPPRPAGHLVLRLAYMPAVTVEVGFLSHAAESRRLADPVWQARIGRAIAAGVATCL